MKCQKIDMEQVYKELDVVDGLIQKMNVGNITDLEYKKLQMLLFKYERFYRYNFPVSRTRLVGDKIMFISDTHFGGEKEHARVVDSAYNKALKDNIKTVVHLGDLTESCPNEITKSTEAIDSELDKAFGHMPKEIKTKWLLGNHDYSTIRNHIVLIEKLFNRPNLDILGLSKIVVNWSGLANICLYHEVSQINVGTCYADMQLRGHHHRYELDEEKAIIKVPALCYDETEVNLIKDKVLKGINGQSRAFIIASIQNSDKIIFDLYNTCQSYSISETVELNTKTKVLRKI